MSTANSFEPLTQDNSPDTSVPQPRPPITPVIDSNIQISQDFVCKDNPSLNKSHSTCIFSSHLSGTENSTELIFKGLHIANLNVRHIVPKIDELRIVMANDMGPDIFGACETFLETSIPDNHLAINSYKFIRKDRCDTQDKTGGGVILYYRTSLNCNSNTPRLYSQWLNSVIYSATNAINHWAETHDAIRHHSYVMLMLC